MTRPLDEIDLSMVAEALGDASGDTRYWYDPATGSVEMTVADWYGDDQPDPDEEGWVAIDPEGSRSAYEDMEAFVEALGDTHAADVLGRAIEGRGAFRRFRDALSDFDELREPWLAYSRACAEQRAIDWLLDGGHVTAADAGAALAQRRAVCAALVTLVGQATGPTVELADLEPRVVGQSIDRGERLTVLRDGEPWAVVTPVDTSGRSSRRGRRG